MWGEKTPWKNETAWWTFIRGLLRRGWNKHPQKLNKIKADRKQVPNPNFGSRKGNKESVWGATCEMCKNDFVLKDIQVDHIEAAGTLKCEEDLLPFIKKLLFVTEDDLRLVCKNCNNALALSQKMGISFDEAYVEKRAIKVIKDKQDKTVLEEAGITPAGNQKARRDQLVELFKKGV